MVLELILLSTVLSLLFFGQVRTAWLAALALGAAALWALARRRGHTHGAFLSIEAYAQKSRMAGWNSGLKIGLSVAGAVVCIAARSPLVAVYFLAAMSVLTVAVGRVPPAYYLSSLSMPALFILLSCLAILVEIGPDAAGVLSVQVGGWALSVTRQGQRAALHTLLRALGAVSCLYLLSLSTPMSRIIATLRRCRVPGVVIELMYLIYRYLFVLLDTHYHMTHAAQSRLGYRGLIRSLKTMSGNALGLLFLSFRRTSDLLSAMEARCYDGEIRFLSPTQPLDGKQLATAVGLLAGALLVEYLERRG